MKRRLSLALMLGLVGILLSAGPVPVAHAATFTVNSQTDAVDANPGDGVCATAALPGEGVRCTLRAAVMEANALAGPDLITVSPGTYRLTLLGKNEDAAATGDLDIISEMTIVGAGRDATFLDGNYNVATIQTGDRVLDVLASGNLTLRDLTVQHGVLYGGGCGAGIQNAGRVGIERSSIADNNAGTATSCSGGGIVTSGTLRLDDSIVQRNSTNGGSGGGIHNTGTLTVVTTTISQNGAFGASHDGPNGGGISNTGTLILAKSTLAANVARFGGGGLYNAGQASIGNSTISGNTAQALPGHNIVNAPTGIMNVADSTIFANAAEAGSAIFNARTEPAVSLANTIVANIGSGGTCSGAITSDGYNIDTGPGCQLTQATDHPSTNAGLAALGNNGGPTPTHALIPGSPAIDAGPPVLTQCSPGPPCSTPTGRESAQRIATGAARQPVPSSGQARVAPDASVVFCATTDQRGQARPLDGDSDGTARCDIGAYEAPVGRTVPPSACSPRPPVRVATASDGSGRLKVTVSATGSGNSLVSLSFTTNAAEVDIQGQLNRSGAFTVALPARPQQETFVVHRRTFVQVPEAATTSIIVNDSCGAWSTFVGIGAGVP